MQHTYLLAESVVTLTGTKEFLTDIFDDAQEHQQPSTTASAVLDLRGDEGGGLRTLAVKDRGQRDLTIGLTTDRRLSTVSYKSVGSGSRVLAGAAKLLATVVGVGLRLSVPGAGGGGTESYPENEPPPDSRGLTADERAQQEWDATHVDLASRRSACVDVIQKASQAELGQWRSALADTGQIEASLAQARRLAGLAERARAEVERIDALYAAWRAGTKVTRQEVWTYTLSMAQLPDRPGPPLFAGAAQEAWAGLGIGVQLERLDGPRRPPTQVPESEVCWRVPRRVRVNVWQAGGSLADAPILKSSTLAMIVDETCDLASLPLTSRYLGDDGLELAFGELGVPARIGTARTSGVAAAADALGSLPSDALTGLETASKLQAAVSGLQDAGMDRKLQGLKRRLETAQQEIQLKADAATAHDFVRLKLLEQQVAIAEATGKLAPSTELEELTYEASLLEKRKKLEALTAD